MRPAVRASCKRRASDQCPQGQPAPAPPVSARRWLRSVRPVPPSTCTVHRRTREACFAALQCHRSLRRLRGDGGTGTVMIATCGTRAAMTFFQRAPPAFRCERAGASWRVQFPARWRLRCEGGGVGDAVFALAAFQIGLGAGCRCWSVLAAPTKQLIGTTLVHVLPELDLTRLRCRSFNRPRRRGCAPIRGPCRGFAAVYASASRQGFRQITRRDNGDVFPLGSARARAAIVLAALISNVSSR